MPRSRRLCELEQHPGDAKVRLAIFLGLDILGGPAHAADLSGFKEDAVLWAIEGHGLGHVHAASLDVP